MSEGKPERRPPRGSARSAALRMLARRDHAASELRERLLGKGFPEGAVDEALESLSARGHLDDSRFVESFVRRELERGHGALWIASRLARRGIRPAPPLPAGDEFESLKALLRRRRVGPATLTDARERFKIMRFLRGRGYRSAAISAALGPGLEEETGD